MKICPHDLATKETACADGMCPICAANDARGYEFQIERLRAELTDAKARAKTAEANWHKNEARLAKLHESIKTARVELNATQRNWDEDCLFRCDIILAAVLKGSA